MADRSLRKACRQRVIAKSLRAGGEPPSRDSRLLVVLPIEEARDVDRLAAIARRRILVVDLRLGGTAGDVRHALEQGARLADLRLLLGRCGLGQRSRPRRPAERSAPTPTGAVRTRRCRAGALRPRPSRPSARAFPLPSSRPPSPERSARPGTAGRRAVVARGKANTLAGCGCCAASASMPVATTETRILPSRSLLNAEPQMMLASGSTSSLMWLAASSTSIRRMSSPPVIEMMTPLAPFMHTPSSSGFEIAFSAASIARLSPELRRCPSSPCPSRPSPSGRRRSRG